MDPAAPALLAAATGSPADRVAQQPHADNADVRSADDEGDALFTREGHHEGDFDAELGGWVYDTLQRLQPGIEISVGSVKAVVDLLDGVTTSVLEEAKRISQGGAGGADDGAPGSQAKNRSRSKQPPLTSLDIHQALKRLLPSNNQPGERLRPYLPAVTKQAWHLDKASLKGVKAVKRKRDAEAEEVHAAQQGKGVAENSGANVNAHEQPR